MSEMCFKTVQSKREIEILVELAKEIWEQHYVPIIGSAQVAYMTEKFLSVSALTEQLQDGYVYCLVMSEGEPVGFIGYHAEDAERQLFLSKLYLKAACRKKGLARKALSFLRGVCKENGLERIYLTVNRNNHDTIAVYKHLGFVTVKEEKADIGCGFYMDDYIMEYRVE